MVHVPHSTGTRECNDEVVPCRCQRVQPGCNLVLKCLLPINDSLSWARKKPETNALMSECECQYEYEYEYGSECQSRKQGSKLAHPFRVHSTPAAMKLLCRTRSTTKPRNGSHFVCLSYSYIIGLIVGPAAIVSASGSKLSKAESEAARKRLK